MTINTWDAERYADHTFAGASHELVDGNNTFTAIALDALGRSDTHAITVNLPATLTFLYDQNGNLRTNGSVVLAYDDENQLIAMTNAGTWASTFAYDGKMRLRINRDFEWRNGAWVQTNEVRRVYDEMLVLQERDTFNVPKLTYTRGKDLSGSLEGAGGIGGILSLSEHSASSFEHSYFHADGNGNVTGLVNSNQVVVARYLYDPFGNTLMSSGPKAAVNCYRFSSKPIHELTGKYDFLYRWYAPELQRWLNRDPLEEEGGPNLYVYVGNDSINSFDPLGLLPPSNPTCQALKRKIDNLEKEIRDRSRELYEDPQGLPGTAPGDDVRPSLSRRGHQRLLNMTKANLAAKKALYQANCSDPEPPPKRLPFCPIITGAYDARGHALTAAALGGVGALGALGARGIIVGGAAAAAP